MNFTQRSQRRDEGVLSVIYREIIKLRLLTTTPFPPFRVLLFLGVLCVKSS